MRRENGFEVVMRNPPSPLDRVAAATVATAPFLMASGMNSKPSFDFPGRAKKTEFFFTRRESMAMSSISIWLGSPLISKSTLACKRSWESFMNQLIKLLRSGTRIGVASDWTTDD